MTVRPLGIQADIKRSRLDVWNSTIFLIGKQGQNLYRPDSVSYVRLQVAAHEKPLKKGLFLFFWLAF